MKGSEVYSIHSCGACLRIAARRSVSIGDRLEEGLILAFAHLDSSVQALTSDADGRIVPVALHTIEDRRMFA